MSSSSSTVALALSAIAFVSEANAFTGAPSFAAPRFSTGVATSSRAHAAAPLGLRMADRVPFMAGNWKMNPTNVDEVPPSALSPFPDPSLRVPWPRRYARPRRGKIPIRPPQSMRTLMRPTPPAACGTAH